MHTNNPQTIIRSVRRVTWAGLVVNLLLSAFKMLAGWFGHSQAVLADGVHSLSDSTTDIAILIGVKYWSQPPDETHPHGHQRIETIVTALIGLVLGGVAIGLAWNAVATMMELHDSTPSIITLIAALLSIVGKEAMYRWSLLVGRKYDSPAVIANAWHHRSDGLSSIPAALAVGIAILFPGLAYVDHVGAIIVSLFILHAAWTISMPALRELADHGVSSDLRDEIQAIALETEGVMSIHKCRTRYLGSRIQVDLHVVMDGTMTVTAAHDIAMEATRRIKHECPAVLDVLTHIEPHRENGR